jgi:TIR domain
MQTAEQSVRVFISYSRKDIIFADQLGSALKEKGFEPLIDRNDIYAFEDWWKRIEAMIESADAVVFVLSPDAVTSKVSLRELTYAAQLNKRLAPIVFRRVEVDSIPETLQRLSFIYFDDQASFEDNADNLASALQIDIEWVRQHTEFGEAARRWSRADHAIGLFLRSPLLEKAERWIVSRPRGAPEPTLDIPAFIAGSRREANRRKHRAFAFGIVFLLVAVAGLSYVIWSNQFYIRVHAGELIDRVSPKTLSADAEQMLKPKQTFKECTN